MTTLLEPRTASAGTTYRRHCPGCPRCQDTGAAFCAQPHPQHANLHPVCKRCGHCVLRGKHDDDISDLQ